MRTIDINSDLGESFGNWRMGNDEVVIPEITSANVACGFHASDPVTMIRTVALCKQHGVEVGSHPGLPDLLGFGRRPMRITAGRLLRLRALPDGRAAGRARGGGHGAAPHQAARRVLFDPARGRAAGRRVLRGRARAHAGAGRVLARGPGARAAAGGARARDPRRHGGLRRHGLRPGRRDRDPAREALDRRREGGRADPALPRAGRRAGDRREPHPARGGVDLRPRRRPERRSR